MGVSENTVRVPTAARSSTAQLAADRFAACCANVLGAIFSFETLFVLYLFAGRFKADDRFSWVPVDLTLLLMISSMGVGLRIVAKRGKLDGSALAGVLLYVLFAGWAAISLVWAPQSSYGEDKVLRMTSLVLWAYAGAALIISPEPRRIHRFFRALVILSVWLGVEALYAYLSSGSSEPQLRQVAGSNYLGVGRTVGAALLVVVVGWLFSRQRNMLRTVLRLAGVLLFSLVLIAAGGRGPFLATAIGVWLAFTIKHRISKVAVIALTLAAVAFVVVTTNSVPATTLSRFSVLLEDSYGGSSVFGRLIRMEGAWQQFQISPVIGRGIGSFYHYRGNPLLERDYPHNIFLEVMAELGLVGLALLCMLTVASVRPIRWERLSQEPLQLLVTLFLTNSFVNSLVSGDLSDNRLLFTALGLSVAARRV